MTIKIAQIFGFIMLLVGSFAFGLLGKPTEMGLSILAGAIALAFSNIEKIKRFKGAGFEAEMLERRVEAMVAKDAEPETKEALPASIQSYGLDSSTRNVVLALGNSKYTWRTISGVAQESGLSTAAVKKSINWLALNGLVVEARTGKRPNWGLSEEGRELFNAIQGNISAV